MIQQRKNKAATAPKEASKGRSRTVTKVTPKLAPRIQAHYYIIYKPFGMLSQFTPEGAHATLAALGDFPKDVYPVGRLDADSEGLLLLTNDKAINNQLLNPSFKHWRTYWAQVDGQVTPEACAELSKGLKINLKGQIFQTLPCKAKQILPPIDFPERNPPIRVRKNIPTTWIEIELVEGKNHQVRKMTAAVGFPTLRLIRVGIENLKIDKMQPSQIRKLSKDEVYKGLNI